MKRLIRCALATIFLLGLPAFTLGQTPPSAKKDQNPSAPDPAGNATPEELFEQRIMPIFRSPNPSSCVQCHLSSVDLKNYILPSSEKTFVSLRDQGLIDMDSPGQSKILTLIKMGDLDRDRGAKLIHEKMRQAEFNAFTSWIKSCCADPDLRKLPVSDEKSRAKPKVPDSVIRHSRKSRVVNSFVRNVWSQRMRCFPCHTPNDIQPNQTKAREKFDDLESQYGDRMLIFRKTPRDTVKYLIERSLENHDDEYPLVNLDDPTKSLLVLKPTAKLPPRKDGKFLPPGYKDPVSHMGGLKMHHDDQSYKSFLAWMDDYSKVVKGVYRSESDLPADNWFATRKVLRLKETPGDWKVGATVQLTVHAREPKSGKWAEQPVAFTQGTVTPRKIVNGTLFLLAPKNPEQRQKWLADRKKLMPGKYQIRVYLDSQKKIAAAPAMMLGEEDLVGTVEKDARWQIGFPKAEMISAKNLK